MERGISFRDCDRASVELGVGIYQIVCVYMYVHINLK
jgi:hypothetical protein